MGIFESVLIGISIAAIPGPIFFELIRRTLIRGFWPGVSLSIGEFLGNFTIMALLFLGMSGFLAYGIFRIMMHLAGGAILLLLGVNAFRLKNKEIEKQRKNKPLHDNSMIAGFGIAVTSPM